MVATALDITALVVVLLVLLVLLPVLLVVVVVLMHAVAECYGCYHELMGERKTQSVAAK